MFSNLHMYIYIDAQTKIMNNNEYFVRSTWCYTSINQLGDVRLRQADSRTSQASQSSKNDELQVWLKTLSQKFKVKIDRGRYWLAVNIEHSRKTHLHRNTHGHMNISKKECY